MSVPFYTDLSEFSTPPNFQGIWDVKKAYRVGSIVDYNGNLYVAQSLVDHSTDAATLLNHDDFHRADTLDGWGTSTEGIDWDAPYEDPGPGVATITNNEGVINLSTGNFAEADMVYNITSLATRNIEFVCRFYTTMANQVIINFNILGEGVIFSAFYQSSPLFSEIKLFSANTPEIEGIFTGNQESLFVYGDPLLPLLVNTDYLFKMQAFGSQYRAKLWEASNTEPEDWNIVLANTFANGSDTTIEIDSYTFSDMGTVNIKDVKVYGLPDVSPDHMPSEWALIG